MVTKPLNSVPFSRISELIDSLQKAGMTAEDLQKLLAARPKTMISWVLCLQKCLYPAAKHLAAPEQPLSLDASIAELGLNVRIVNRLHREGIRTIGELYARCTGNPKKQKISGFAKKSWADISDALASAGYPLNHQGRTR